MLIWGYIADGYKLLAMGFLIVLSVRGATSKRGVETVGLLCFMIFFAVSTMMDRLDFWYEPVIFGYGAEYGGFLLLFFLGITILLESVQLRRRSALLLQKEISAKKHMEEVVHDLKAPLSAIRMYAELTRADPGLSKEEQDQFLMEIEKRTGELGRRIQLLGKTEIVDAGLLEWTEVESLSYLEGIAAHYRDMAEKNGIGLYVEGESFSIDLDPEKMSLAMENLIMNAIRYTSPGGFILLSAEKRGDEAVLSVSDTGMGIDAEEMNRIFDRGYTEDRTHSGLGLHIVSGIVRAHDGTIEAASEKGKGTHFILHLKLARKAESAL